MSDNTKQVAPSCSSIYWWGIREEPFRQMGNRVRTQLVGIDMIHLVRLLIGTPDATIEEMTIHVYNIEGGGTPL